MMEIRLPKLKKIISNVYVNNYKIKLISYRIENIKNHHRENRIIMHKRSQILKNERANTT